MKKFDNIIESNGTCTMIFEGEKNTDEPICGVIQFPGGKVDVTRTNSGYWATIIINNETDVFDSRIGYDYESSMKFAIHKMPRQKNIKQISIRIKTPHR